MYSKPPYSIQYLHSITGKVHVRGSVHQSTFLTVKTPNKMQRCIKMLSFLLLNEGQHVSGDTLPIIRSLKLHNQPLVLYTWKVVGRCQVAYAI